MLNERKSTLHARQHMEQGPDQPVIIKQATKKPITIEYIQYTGKGECMNAILAWTKDSETPAFVDVAIRNKSAQNPEGFDYPELFIKTLEGNHLVSINDYVIKGISGEFYPCKPSIFLKTYDLVFTLDEQSAGVSPEAVPA